MSLLQKARTFLTYCFYGLIATLFETGLYSLFYLVLALPNIAATLISWVLTVILAFFTNKVFVYRSREWKARIVLSEIAGFFSCRILTGILNAVWMYVMVDMLALNGVVMKLLAALVVGIVNYVVGLFLVFSRSRKSQQTELQEP